MNTILKSKVSQSRDELIEVEGKLSVIKERISIQKKYMDERSKDEKDLTEKYEAEIKEAEEKATILEGEISVLREKIDFHLADIVDKTTIEKTKNNLESVMRQLNSKTKNLNTSVDFYDNNNTCPTCTQHIEQEFKDSMIATLNTKKQEIEKAITNINTSLSDTDKQLEKIAGIIRIMKVTESAIQERKSELSGYKKFSEKTKQKLNEAKSNTKDDTQEQETLAIYEGEEDEDEEVAETAAVTALNPAAQKSARVWVRLGAYASLGLGERVALDLGPDFGVTPGGAGTVVLFGGALRAVARF
jgi:chromosome segregation ATPase